MRKLLLAIGYSSDLHVDYQIDFVRVVNNTSEYRNLEDEGYNWADQINYIMLTQEQLEDLERNYDFSSEEFREVAANYLRSESTKLLGLEEFEVAVTNGAVDEVRTDIRVQGYFMLNELESPPETLPTPGAHIREIVHKKVVRSTHPIDLHKYSLDNVELIRKLGVGTRNEGYSFELGQKESVILYIPMDPKQGVGNLVPIGEVLLDAAEVPTCSIDEKSEIQAFINKYLDRIKWCENFVIWE